jgi:hypothetical protein
MEGVITRVQVLAHPVIIVESFGVRVLVRALLARQGETFLEIVRRCAEDDAHRGMAELDLCRTVERFMGFECLAGDLYLQLAHHLAHVPEAGAFFNTISRHEQGHATVLGRVRREISRGRLWAASRDLHFKALDEFESRLSSLVAEARQGADLARALEMVQLVEGSELNVVFDALRESVDMRSRQNFERFFVLTGPHVEYCGMAIERLRRQHGIPGAWTIRAPARVSAH